MSPLISAFPLYPVNIVELVFAYTCIVSCVLLWSTPRSRSLCALLILQAVLMLLNFSEETGLFNQTVLITPIFTLLTGPAFYFFVKHLVYGEKRWRWSYLVHVLPAVLVLPLTHYPQLIIVLGSVSMVCYGVLAYRLLRQYALATRAMESEILSVDLNWLMKLMLAFAVLAITDIIRLNLQPYLDHGLLNTWYFFHQSTVLGIFLFLVFLTLKQPELFNGLSVYEETLVGSKNQEREVLLLMFQQLDRLVRERELYLVPRFSLTDLSNESNLNIRDISEAINIGGQLNFNDYINRYRLELVKMKLTQAQTISQRVNILEIAIESGFSSKSSFNSLFKKNMGMTPTQFLKSRSES